MLWNNKDKAKPAEENAAQIRSIPLTEGVVWDLDTQPLIQFVSGANTEVYASIEAHSNAHAELEHYAFDLPNNLTPADAPKARIATNIQEVWDLSEALTQEIASRQKDEGTGKTILVLINQHENLLSNTELADNEFYQKTRANLTEIIKEAEHHDINVLFA